MTTPTEPKRPGDLPAGSFQEPIKHGRLDTPPVSVTYPYKDNIDTQPEAGKPDNKSLASHLATPIEEFLSRHTQIGQLINKITGFIVAILQHSKPEQKEMSTLLKEIETGLEEIEKEPTDYLKSIKAREVLKKIKELAQFPQVDIPKLTAKIYECLKYILNNEQDEKEIANEFASVPSLTQAIVRRRQEINEHKGHVQKTSPNAPIKEGVEGILQQIEKLAKDYNADISNGNIKEKLGRIQQRILFARNGIEGDYPSNVTKPKEVQEKFEKNLQDEKTIQSVLEDLNRISPSLNDREIAAIKEYVQHFLTFANGGGKISNEEKNEISSNIIENLKKNGFSQEIKSLVEGFINQSL